MTVHAETTTAGTYRVESPAELARVVSRISTKNPYVVVTRDDRAGFAQVHLNEGADLVVEYRGGPRSLLRRAQLPQEDAVRVLTGWAFDHAGWRRGIAWEAESLERCIDTLSHCRFEPAGALVRCRLAGAAPEGLEWMWDIVAEGPDDPAAHAEWRTRLAVTSNTGSRAQRIAMGELLGSWVIEGSSTGSRLSAQQLARIDASSQHSWAGGPPTEAQGRRASTVAGWSGRPVRCMHSRSSSS